MAFEDSFLLLLGRICSLFTRPSTPVPPQFRLRGTKLISASLCVLKRTFVTLPNEPLLAILGHSQFKYSSPCGTSQCGKFLDQNFVKVLSKWKAMRSWGLKICRYYWGHSSKLSICLSHWEETNSSELSCIVTTTTNYIFQNLKTKTPRILNRYLLGMLVPCF